MSIRLAEQLGVSAGAGHARAPVLRLLPPADTANRARWDAFVHDCPDATFFHLSGWQEVLHGVYGHRTWFYYAERDGEIVGVLPLAQIKSRLFGHYLGSLPFCVLGGIATNDALARIQLDAAAEVLAQALGVGHLEHRGAVPTHTGDPSWLTRELYVNFRKEISRDDEENLQAIPRKQRAAVRKGMQSGLRAELDDNVDRFFTAYAHSMHRLGTPVFPRKHFRALKHVFGDACEIRIIVRDHSSNRQQPGGELMAGLMSFYWRDEVLPYYGGAMPAARLCAGNDYAYWNLMQAAAARGCTTFDFGRSKLGTGAFDFKKNWGFAPAPLGYEYKLFRASHLPENNPLNPKFRFLINMWKRMPLRAANFLGPYIVRSLG